MDWSYVSFIYLILLCCGGVAHFRAISPVAGFLSGALGLLSFACLYNEMRKK